MSTTKLERLERQKQALLKQIAAEQKKINDVLRKEDDARKFALGGMVMAEAQKNPEFREMIDTLIKKRALRHHKKYFMSDNADRHPFTPLDHAKKERKTEEKAGGKNDSLRGMINHAGGRQNQDHMADAM